MDALECSKVDDDVNKCILIGDGLAVANMRSFDSEGHSLGVNTFGSGPLGVDLFVGRAFAVQLRAQPGANTGGDRGGTSTFSPVLMGDWAGPFFGIRSD